MDCQILELPEWLTCNFERQRMGMYGKEDSKRELWDLILQGRHRLSSRVDSLLRDSQGNIDEALRDFTQRRDELRSLIASCDEECFIDYLRKFFEKRQKKLSANNDERARDFLEWELREYFAQHPEVEKEIKKWYTLYNNGKPIKSELLKLLPGVLESVEKRTWATIGFIPMKGWFITIFRNADGSYYALEGETVSKGKSLESAIAPFASNTTMLQIIDTSGKVIGSVETPLSRSLEALLFIERHQSVWSLLTGDKGKALDISYHQDGHKISLRTPREWIQVEFSEWEETLSRIGRVSGKRFSIGYNMRTGFSESTISLGRWSLRGEAFRVEWTQARISNHIHIWEIPVSEKAIGLHGIGSWDMKVQGNLLKPDTAKLDGKQAIALTWDQYYFWYGRAIRWTPELIDKKYTQFTKSALFIAWARYGNLNFEASNSNGVTQLNLSRQWKASSLEAMIEYQKRMHILLWERSVRAQVSYVEQF